MPKRKAPDKKLESKKKAILRPLGEHLRRLRLERHFSQGYVAERAALNYKYLGRVEHAEANPSADVLVRLARALSVPVGELFETIAPSGDSANRLTQTELNKIFAAAAELSAIVERIRSNAPPPSPSRSRAPKRPCR